MRLLLDVTQVDKGVWLTLAPPHQLGIFGQPKTTRGERSVLLASSPTFDKGRNQLLLDAQGVAVLNLGTTANAIVVDAGQLSESSLTEDGSDANRNFGPGDREFYSLMERELRGDVLVAARDLFHTVRNLHPGDLKRGKGRNFSNTPDNFWYVIVQPQKQSLSITVRGAPERFKPSTLELKGDRPGYTRFKLVKSADMPEALRIIGMSKRKDV